MRIQCLQKPVCTLGILCLCVIPLSALTHSGATGVVKERMDAMGDMREQSKRVGDMFKGKTEFDISAIKEAADSFVIHGNTMVSLFPDEKSSREGNQTEALPAIWSEWDEFVSMVDEFVQQSEALQETIATEPDQRTLKKAFLEIRKECSACHKRFRQPKK